MFFVLALAVPWAVRIPAIIHTHSRGQSLADEAGLHHLMSPARGELDPGFAAVLLPALLSLGAGLAGVLDTGLFHGRAGLMDLARRATEVRVPAGWVLTAVLVPLGSGAGSLPAGWVLGGSGP